jgi:hypothetical protein
MPADSFTPPIHINPELPDPAGLLYLMDGAAAWRDVVIATMPSDLDDLLAFADTKSSLADFWASCPRGDWMLWLLLVAHAFGVVAATQVDLSSYVLLHRDHEPDEARRLTLALHQADVLRRALPSVFQNPNGESLDGPSDDVALLVLVGKRLIEGKLLTRFVPDASANHHGECHAPAVRRKSNSCAVAGLCFGAASLPTFPYVITPLLAVLFSVIGLALVKRREGEGRLEARVGLVLGILFTLAMLNFYGYIPPSHPVWGPPR